jgi:hypothetical protein
VLICACLCVAAGPGGEGRPARLSVSVADADRFVTKWAVVVAHHEATVARRRRDRQTTITESEVNAYLRFRAKGVVPIGVADPYVFALGDGRLAVEAVVDLDAVRLSRERGMFDVAQLLRGRVPVTATGVLRSHDGTFRIELETATAAGFNIPKSLLQELVSYYSRTSSNPAGFDLDSAFELPAGIRQLTVQARKAIIVQ